MIVLLLCALVFCLVLWWTAELPELWIALAVAAPILEHLT